MNNKNKKMLSIGFFKASNTVADISVIFIREVKFIVRRDENVNV